MERLHRKVAYLEGLAEGLELSPEQKEGRILLEMIQLCKIMANRLEELQMRLDEQEEYIGALDDDLNDLENFIFGEEEDVDTGMVYDQDETGYYEIECPHCREKVLVDQEDYEDEGTIELKCPECEEIFILDGEEEGHHHPQEQTFHS